MADINGTNGNDSINGTVDDDIINGNGGDDMIIASSGNDVIDGGASRNDVLDYSGSTTGVTVTIPSSGQTGYVVGGDTGSDSFTNVEILELSDQDDVFKSLSGVTVYRPYVNLGAGDDEVILNNNAGDYDGGDGIDTLISQAELNQVIDLESGTIASYFGAGSISNIENVVASNGDVEIIGSSVDNVLQGVGPNNFTIGGGDGNDTLETQTGRDHLDGGDGDDVLSANSGDDTLIGGSGNDWLQGGAGQDTMSGGLGDDTFYFVGGSGNDVIQDFDLGDHDGDGFTNDQLDVSGLLDDQGDPVDVWDVSVSGASSDPDADAILTFTNGESIRLVGVHVDDVDTVQELNSIGIPCYLRGTFILTERGEVAVEDLKIGDRVVVENGNSAPILWLESTKLTDDQLAENSDLRPIRIKPMALGNTRPLLVSSQHCIVLDCNGERHFARAKHIAQQSSMAHVAFGRSEVEYFHLLLPEHSMIWANGVLSESFYPGPCALQMISAQSKLSLLAATGAQSERALQESYGERALPVMKRAQIGAHVGDSYQAHQPHQRVA
ncbi:Hint domain-containing protein [Gymnodinialimonas hymeniacidonis]|uniref:Hint domain-containing protein n=1 Tax=Gymnodinialimonas hymeniacidonis TaxID=3126508 RepID=UPI0034C68E93